MSRYIDADKILYTDLSEGRGVCWVTFMDWIKEMPTADVVEVVRCKDCKWWRPFNDRMGHCGRGEMRHKDFYCQSGERADT